jgi:hypothetical protein
MHPLTALLEANAIAQHEADAGFWYADQLNRFRHTKAKGEEIILQTIRQVLWKPTESGHKFRIVLGIAANGETWKCVTETTAGTVLHHKTPKQIALLREGLQRLVSFRGLKQAA